MPGAGMFETSAEAYDRHVGRYGPSLAAGLIAFAGVEPGMRVVDVGCGPGALSRALAERLGPDRVTAAEPSSAFARSCRERLAGVEVVEAPAEALPFPTAGFDVTLSQLVVNFMTDAPAGVREMVRVTRPGGTVAACVWDYAGDMTLLRAFWDAAGDVDPQAAAGADEGAVMRWCSPGELEDLWTSAGLAGVRTTALVVDARYADFDDLWAPFPAGVGPSGAFCAALPDERRAELRDAYRRRLAVGDEPFALTARAWAVAGRV